jgi:hypothetical protein
MPDSLTYKQFSQLVSPLKIYQPEQHATFSSVFFRPPYLTSFNQFMNHLTKFMKRIMGATLLETSNLQLPATSGFGGLVVRMLASGTQDRGFKPGRSRRIFWAKKSSACLPSEGKQSRLSHVAELRHVKEPYNLPWKSQIIVRTFLDRFRSTLTEVSGVA